MYIYSSAILNKSYQEAESKTGIRKLSQNLPRSGWPKPQRPPSLRLSPCPIPRFKKNDVQACVPAPECVRIARPPTSPAQSQ